MTVKSERAILEALFAAERARMRALRRLADLPVGREPSGFLLRADLADALAMHDSRLRRAHGYRGHAVGWKSRRGRADPVAAIVVFVEAKLKEDELRRRRLRRVPPELPTRAGAIITDVVALRATRKDTAAPGASVGPTPGTLACLAWNAAAQLVALTAGHVAQVATSFVSPAGSTEPLGVLGVLSLSPVDAATIIVTSPSSPDLPDGSHMVGVRRLTELDIGQPVYVYGAQTGRWSAGQLLYLAPWISGWGIADGAVHTAPTQPGDSGGPVVDQYGYLVGVHLGRGRYHGGDVAIAQGIGRIAHDLQITPAF